METSLRVSLSEADGEKNQKGLRGLTLWSMYLLSSMAERLEWSQEDDEAEGRRRNKQLVSCCCRSMNCFMKLSLERTTIQQHNIDRELINLKEMGAAGPHSGNRAPECDNGCRTLFILRVATDSSFADRHFNNCERNGQTDRCRSRLTDGLQRRISEGARNPAVH